MELAEDNRGRGDGEVVVETGELAGAEPRAVDVDGVEVGVGAAEQAAEAVSAGIICSGARVVSGFSGTLSLPSVTGRVPVVGTVDGDDCGGMSGCTGLTDAVTADLGRK